MLKSVLALALLLINKSKPMTIDDRDDGTSRILNSEDHNSIDKPPFICSDNGVYPHLNDCERYYLCQDGKLSEKICTPGKSYNHPKGECWKRVVGCIRPDCSGKHDEFIAHPADNQLYVKCLGDKPSQMYKCYNNTQFAPEATTNPPCKEICRTGFYPNAEQAKFFLKCKRVGGKLINLGFSCPDGYKLKYQLHEGIKCVKTKLALDSNL